MALVSAFETILISFIGVLIPNLQADFPLNIAKYSENSRQRNKILSENYLLTRQKANSKLMCGILCGSEPFCKMFRFEAPSVGCIMYREAITGGCFGLPSPFLSYFYIHQGSATSWLMLYYFPFVNEVGVWSERTTKWEIATIQDKMSSVCVDFTDWRVYWAHAYAGIFSSNIVGRYKTALRPDTKSTSVALDSASRRLFYDSDKEDYVGVYDLDTERFKVFHHGDGQGHDICKVNVIPDLKLVLWVDNNKVWRKHYNESEAQEIPSIFKADLFTVDSLYHRLIWGFDNTTALFFSDLWGTERVNFALSEKIPIVPSLFVHDGNLFLMNQYSFRIRMFNCKGNLVRSMAPSRSIITNEVRHLVWIPENVYYNL